ncbi:MAG: MucBP domain-containing protein [Clostridia bacterium]|nr:MucBP domain-containing protein [Clostridia bacterium]
MGTLRNKILWIGVALLVLVALVASILIPNVQKLTMSQEDRLAMTYKQFTDEDKKVEGCDNVEFLAYFLRDLNRDGIADKLAGTTMNVAGQDVLYMELNVVSDGTLEDGKITISEGNNYKVRFDNFIKDGFFAQNYINIEDGKEILLDNVNAGTQRLILSSITAKILNKDYFSKNSKITLTGTHVSSDGETRTPINKEIDLKVDWYGSLEAYIDAPSDVRTRYITQTDEEYASPSYGVDTLPEYAAAPFTVEVKTGDRVGVLPIKSTSTTIKIPNLNGYEPEWVRPTVGTYDEETKTITISYNDNNYSVSNRNRYAFDIKYPLEAFKQCFYQNGEILEDAKAEFLFEVHTSYTGYNNPNYTNPISSETQRNLGVIIMMDRGGDKPIGVVTKEVKFHENTYATIERNPLTWGITDRYFDGNTLLSAYDNEDQKYYYYVVDYNVVNGTDEDTSIVMYNLQQDRIGSYGLDLYESNCFIYTNSESLKYALGEEGKIDIYGIEYVNEMPYTTYHSLENAQYQHAAELEYKMRGPFGLTRNSDYTKIYLDDVFGKSFVDRIFNEISNSEWDHIITGETFGNIENGDPSPTWIKIETTPMKAHTALNVHVVKRLDMDLVRRAFTRQQIEDAGTIRTYLDQDKGDSVQLAFSKSEAKISWDSNKAFETQQENDPTLNRSFTIGTTYRNAILHSKWQNGAFVVELPSEFVKVDVKDVTMNNGEVVAWSLLKDKTTKKQYIKILTENAEPTAYESINVNLDIVPDARSRSTNSQLKLYYFNEYNNKYYNVNTDIYDTNNNGSKEDTVGFATCNTPISASETLITVQTVLNYDDDGSITVAPNIAELSKETRSADIDISVVNNYKQNVTGTKILGRVPYEGNKYVLRDRELGSVFTAAMTGPIVVPEDLQENTTIYYSAVGEPGKDIENAENGWKTADQITDWSTIKSYLIDFSSVTLRTGIQYEFTYPVTIPEGLNYNDTSYATHAVEYDYNSPYGIVHLETEPTKVGLKITRLYDLTGLKLKEGFDLSVKGAIYQIAEKNVIGDLEQKKLFISGNDGAFNVQNLYVNAVYQVKEVKAPNDYLLSDKKVEFKVVENNDGSLGFEYVTDNHFRTQRLTKDTEDNDLLYIEIENEPKYQINITYIDVNTNEPMYSVVTKLGEDIKATDANGLVSYGRLLPGTEYTLEEVQVKGNIRENYDFILERDGETYTATLDEGMRLESIVNNEENHLIQVNVIVEKESNPVYTLEVVKVEKDASKKDLASMKKIPGAVFSLERVDDNELEDNLVTDENGVAVARALYQYVPGVPISGEYILKEIEAPDGYIENTEEIKFVTTKINDELKVEIENRDSLTSIKDVIIEENKVTLVIQDIAYFKLTKTDSETGELLPNAKFVIYELDNDGNIIDCGKDVYGNYVGEQDEGAPEDSPYYVYTNEAGVITLPLRDGKYRIDEVQAPDGYTGEGSQTFELNNHREVVNEAPYELNEIEIEDNYVEPVRENTVQIQYVEDLLAIDNEMIDNDNTYADTKFVLANDIDFSDEESYRDATSTTYGDINEDGEVSDIKTELTTGNGFKSIGLYFYTEEWDYNDQHYSRTESKFKPFSGTFDGNGHEIKNINQSGREYAGLFAMLKNAVVKNLTISGTIVTGGSDYSLAAGSIAAKAVNSISLENCNNEASVNSNYAGGLIGNVDGYALSSEETNALTQSDILKIKNCKNSGTIDGINAGGIVGRFNNSSSSIKMYESIFIEDCKNTGTINVKSGYNNYSGGIIGDFNDYTVKNLQVINCSNTANTFGGIMGNIYSEGGLQKVKFKNIKNTGNVTFLIGKNMYMYNCEGTVQFIDCYNNGETGVFMDQLYGYSGDKKINVVFYNCINKGSSVYSSGYTGGLVGLYSVDSDYIHIINCGNEGNIGPSMDCGGLIGLFIGNNNADDILIYNSYNTGNIQGTQFTAGLIGASEIRNPNLDFRNCYNTGKISGSGTMAGIVGYVHLNRSESFKNCYNEGEIEGTYSLGGIIGYASDAHLVQIENCYNKGYIHTTEETSCYYMGGIAGFFVSGTAEGSYVKDSYNLGNITKYGTQAGGLGGIIGWGPFELIDNCYNKGNITSYEASENGVGGIIGYTWQSGSFRKVISNCTNYGKINLKQSYTAGIVGYGYGINEINNCFNYGNITMLGGTNGYMCGIDAYAADNVEIKNCFNKGNMLADRGSYAAGITAYCYSGRVECCYNTGDVIFLKPDDSQYGGYCKSAGIIAQSSGTKVVNVYNEGKIVGSGQCGGIVGYISGQESIVNAYNTGDVISTLSDSLVKNANRIGAITAYPSRTDYIYNPDTDNYDEVKVYDVLKNTYYSNDILVDSSSVDVNDTAVDYDYMTTVEFYNKLNVDGVWYLRKNLPPTLMMKTPVYGEATELEVTNDKNDYIIATRVIGDENGGTISGQDVAIYETVEAGENNEKTIEVEVAENYTLLNMSINNKKIDFASKMVDDKVVLEAGYFNDMDEDKLVAVTFAKNPVEIEKVDEDTGESLAGAKLHIKNYDTAWAEDANQNAFGELTACEGSTYYFVKNSNGEYVSNNQYRKGTCANSYIPIDLRDYKGVYTLKVGYYVRADYADYGYLTIREDTVAPTHSDVVGRFAHDYNHTSSYGATTSLEGGKVYYLHMGYFKSQYSSNRYDDCMKVTSLQLTIDAGNNIDQEIEVGENGKFVVDIPTDVLFIQEVEAPMGYQLDDTVHEYDLTQSRQIRFTNKVDDTQQPVIVHHYLINNGVKTTNKVAEDETLRGLIGKEYSTSPKKLEGLTVNADEFPENAVGVFSNEIIEVNYYYDIDNIDLTIHHYKEGTTTAIVPDEVVTTTPSIVVENNSYTLSLNQEYVIKNNEKYNTLINGNYKFVDVFSDAEEALTISKTLHYSANAQLTYTYEDKIYDIKTQVNTHIETVTDSETGETTQVRVAGGTISGQDLPVYEQVLPGEDATKDIVITADDGYTINNVKIISTDDDGVETAKVLYGEEAEECEVTYTGDERGITLTTFEDVHAHKTVSVTFAPIPKDAMVLVHHTIEGKGEDYQTVIIEGIVGDEYRTEAITIPGYKLKATPLNATGRMTEATIDVYYIYEPKDCKIIIKYIDIYSEEEIDREELDGKYDEEIDIRDYSKEIDGYTLRERPEETRVKYAEEEQVYTYKYARNMQVRAIYVDPEGNKVAEDVVISGYEGKAYETEAKDVDGYELVEVPSNASGTMRIGEDGNTEIVVRYEYKKIEVPIPDTKVVEKYVDINSGEVVESYDHNGKVGDKYDIAPRKVEGYVLIQKDKDGNSIMPKNERGIMTEEVIEVVYYVAKDAKVKAKYVVKYGGKDIADEEEIPGYEGKEYSVDPKDIDGYELIEIDGNPEGTMKPGENVVTFYYAKKATGIIPQTGINVFLYAMFAIAIIVVANGTLFIVYKMKK